MNSRMSHKLKPFPYKGSIYILDNDIKRKIKREIGVMKNIVSPMPSRLIKYFEDCIEHSDRHTSLPPLYFQFKKNQDTGEAEYRSILIDFDNEIKELQAEVSAIKGHNDAIIAKRGSCDEMITSITLEFADYFLSYCQELGEVFRQKD
jgi:hypothetical protein